MQISRNIGQFGRNISGMAAKRARVMASSSDRFQSLVNTFDRISEEMKSYDEKREQVIAMLVYRMNGGKLVLFVCNKCM